MAILRIENLSTRIRVYLFGKRIFSFHKKDPYSQIQSNYAAKLEELKSVFGTRKIRVGFLVCEPAKWQYQSVYEALEADPNFEPVVLVTKMTEDLDHYKTLEDCLTFFQDTLGLRTEPAYDDKHGWLPPRNFGIDILFYQQPWFLNDIQSPVPVSDYALTCYAPYAFQVANEKSQYMKGFHRYLWRFFLQDEAILLDIKKLAGDASHNCSVAGYPKLDNYIGQQHCADLPSVGTRKVIIYAPHHSFEKDSLNFATFQRNGKAILDMAYRYRNDVYWIFKPHPRFKYAVIANGIMSQKEIEDYYTAWKELGQIYDYGDYFPLFRRSDALITDCGSFLGEYVPTGHPLFHLWSDSAPYNDSLRRLSASFYRIHSFDQLEQEVRCVILEGDDYKKAERESAGLKLFNPQKSSASQIIRLIEAALDK